MKTCFPLLRYKWQMVGALAISRLELLGANCTFLFAGSLQRCLIFDVPIVTIQDIQLLTYFTKDMLFGNTRSMIVLYGHALSCKTGPMVVWFVITVE